MAWIIETVVDHGKTHFYRFSVTGKNTEHAHSESFSWSVRGLADGPYVLASSVSDKTRRAFEDGRKLAP